MTSSSQGHCDASVETSDVSVSTEPDCLGPCDPGTTVVLEGIVWSESCNGESESPFHLFDIGSRQKTTDMDSRPKRATTKCIATALVCQPC